MSYFAHLIKSLIHQGLLSFTPQLKIHICRHFARYKIIDCLVIMGNHSFVLCSWEMNHIFLAKHKKMPWLLFWHELAGRLVPVLSAPLSGSPIHLPQVLCKLSNTNSVFSPHVSEPSCLSDSSPTISMNWVGMIDDIRVKVKLTEQKKGS